MTEGVKRSRHKKLGANFRIQSLSEHKNTFKIYYKLRLIDLFPHNHFMNKIMHTEATYIFTQALKCE